MYDAHKKRLVSFYERHRRMPGYKELMEMTGFKSKNAVYKLIQNFVEAGVVEKDRDGHLIPGSRMRGCSGGQPR